MDTSGVSETKKRPGRKALDVVRICSVCGAAVVRPGVLRPVPLCAKHYFEQRRRAKGSKPRGAPRVTVVDAAELLRKVARTLRGEAENYTERAPDGSPVLEPHGEELDGLATHCDAIAAGLALTYPTVRGSAPKEGAT